MKNALVLATNASEHLRRPLTWDSGKKLSQHAQFRVETVIALYFTDAHSPWQRACSENTTELLRQYFPKGTDLRCSARDLSAVADALNARPQQTLS